jgi:16S rRNA (cytosine967-C5)-methyltransferase
VRLTHALLGHAEAALAAMLQFSGPADETLSRYFREHRELGQQERAFVAETAFSVLRRKRSLEAAAGSVEPKALLAAALLRVQGLSARALEGLVDAALAARIRGAPAEAQPAVRADLPDWLWQRLSAQQGDAETLRLAQAMLNPAPLDLRANLARTSREAVLERRQASGWRRSPPSTATSCSATAWSRCRTRAASCSPGCWRRAAARWSPTIAPAPAARRSRSAC